MLYAVCEQKQHVEYPVKSLDVMGKSQNALIHVAASYLQGYRLLPISKAGN